MSAHASQDGDGSEAKLVELLRAKTPFEARIIAAVLGNAGIPSWVDDGTRLDEFSITQSMMNLQQVAVRVRSTDLDAARTAIAEAKKAGAEMSEDTDPPADNAT